MTANPCPWDKGTQTAVDSNQAQAHGTKRPAADEYYLFHLKYALTATDMYCTTRCCRCSQFTPNVPYA